MASQQCVINLENESELVPSSSDEGTSETLMRQHCKLGSKYNLSATSCAELLGIEAVSVIFFRHRRRE